MNNERNKIQMIKYFEETAKHILKDCVISNYFDMTEWRDNEDKKIFL